MKNMKAAKLTIFAMISGLVMSEGPLTAIQPSWLRDQTVDMKSELGNFGHINQGQTLLGKLITTNEQNADGCLALS